MVTILTFRFDSRGNLTGIMQVAIVLGPKFAEEMKDLYTQYIDVIRQIFILESLCIVKKFSIIFFSLFCFQSMIFAGPVLSIARDALSILDNYIIDTISSSQDDLWIRAVIRDDISTINNLAITHPNLINQKMNFAKPWENSNKTTALHYAMQAGHTETLAILLARMAQIKKLKILKD